MTTTQIRFTATKSMVSALEELKAKFRFLSDSDIFKLAFSKFYQDEMGYDENGFSHVEQKELDGIIADMKSGKNIEGPFDTMEEFIASMKE